MWRLVKKLDEANRCSVSQLSFANLQYQNLLRLIILNKTFQPAKFPSAFAILSLLQTFSKRIGVAVQLDVCVSRLFANLLLILAWFVSPVSFYGRPEYALLLLPDADTLGVSRHAFVQPFVDRGRLSNVFVWQWSAMVRWSAISILKRHHFATSLLKRRHEVTFFIEVINLDILAQFDSASHPSSSHTNGVEGIGKTL